MTVTALPVERRYRPGHPLSLGAVVGCLRHGRGDPTFVRDGAGIWLARRTPDGPATLLLREDPRAGEVVGQAWGSGAGWLLDGLPDLLGADDDWDGWVAHHRPVADARRANPGWRVPRSRLVLDSLIPIVIEQKVTGREAFAGFRSLVWRFGEPAPGPRDGLRLAPSPAGWLAIPSWEYLRAGVTPQRSDTIIRCARVAGRLEECAELPLPQARARLRAVPGVGVWTMAEVAQRALGDPDSPSFGDYHVAKEIGWALLGHDIDDLQLEELLIPYAGHRYRVQALLALAGSRRPRRAPRMTLPTHLPTRR
ncbi:MAG: DNA-3-methyladenine glycosylase 2 family protein [Tetrasphaera sp.]